MGTDTIYADFLEKLKYSKNSNRATVVFLYGDLGSGKTTFTKNLFDMLQAGFEITSPTFTILKVYDLAKANLDFKTFIHIDAYRLSSYQDLQKIKFEDYLHDSGNLIFIEWPTVIADGGIVPDIRITFEHTDIVDDRKITIS